MFNADGSLRTPDPSEEEEAARTKPAPAEPTPEPKAEAQPEPKPEPKPEPEPAVDDERDLPPEMPGEPSLFNELVINLASQAAMYMGLVDNPLAPKMPTDMHAARQMIDILAMLQQKTRGNLTAEENVLLERILTDLRMQYVAMATTKR